MDSCHLFNFLFGTKKMTTELSKCFSSMGASTTKKSRSHRTPGEGNSKTGGPRGQSPPSPLKQFQQRIVASFGNSAVPNRKSDDQRKGFETSCDSSNCGTYRATLIDSLPYDEQPELSIGVALNPSYVDTINSATNKLPPISSRTTDAKEIITENQIDIDKDKHQLMEPHIQIHPSQAPDIMNESRIQTLSETDNLNLTDKCNQVPINKQMLGNKCKRVVLYSDCEPSQEQRQIVASSAEIYNIVSELGDTRAKLRKVGSLSNHDYQTDVSYDRGGDNNSELDQVEQHQTSVCATASDRLKDKRNVYVRSLVQSIESNSSFESTTPTKSNNPIDLNNNTTVTGFTKPVTFVKPMPPKTPPKTIKAKCLNMQFNLNKPVKIQQLFQNETFLTKFFSHLDPLDRCTAAQVCRLWRNILYANQRYWKDLIMVVDCTQIRREHLVDCILNSLQTTKLKHHKSAITGSDSLNRLVKGVRSSWARYDQPSSVEQSGRCHDNQSDSGSISENTYDRRHYSSFVYDFDLEDVWRIQELCNRFTQRAGGHSVLGQQFQSDSNGSSQQLLTEQQHKQICTASKSSSIPSQISSTLSSVSLSSLLSPLSESSRMESLKEKLYISLDKRGFDSLCLFGATNDDIEDLISKTPIKTHKKIILSRLSNCSITNQGLELFTATFDQLEELELSGCNEITNSLELRPLTRLKRLIITDCINIADGVAHKLVQIISQLDELTIQAYHLTDAFLEYLSLNSDTSKLKRLELPNCKEITNQSLMTIAKHFSQLEALSISGSTKISDDGIEILAEQASRLKVLDLSWCARITDASLECIACDLGDNLTDLILDRNIHITDTGLGYLATMSKLRLLHIRWCPRVTDVGLESVIAIKSLRYLSLAGIHQITARSLLCLVEANLTEVELTNCPAVNYELSLFLSSNMPNGSVIF